MILDTHVLIWFFEGSKSLGLGARRRIEKATDMDPVFVSAITPWEIAMLVSKNRLELSRPLSQWVESILESDAIALAPLTPKIAIDSATLPGTFHKDPADRIIVATARRLGIPLLTVDERILRYCETGHVRAVDARL